MAWAVLAWQLSLMSAIAVGKLVSIHIKYKNTIESAEKSLEKRQLTTLSESCLFKKNWAFEQGVEHSHRLFNSVRLPFQEGGRSTRACKFYTYNSKTRTKNS